MTLDTPKFKRRMSVERRLLSTGNTYLDQGIRVIESGTILIRHKPGYGGSATALELMDIYGNLGRKVIYFDVNYGYLAHRDTKKVVNIIYPTSGLDILNIIKEITSIYQDAVFILDSTLHIIDINDDWNLKFDLCKFVSGIMKIAQKCVVICTVIFPFKPSLAWDLRIDITDKADDRTDRIQYGMVIKLEGWKIDEKIGTITCYINQKNGRFSRAWEQVHLEMQEGVSPGSEFTDGVVTAKGYRNFVRIVNENV